MSEVFIVASMQREVEPGEENHPQVVLEGLLSRVGLPAKRVQEVHWLADQHVSPEFHGIPFSSECARFSWPDTPQHDHMLLHAVSRAIRLNDSRLVILGQSWQGWSAAILLASPSAVGRYNLLPRARLALQITVPRADQSLVSISNLLAERANAAAEAVEARKQAAINPGGPVISLPGYPQEEPEEPEEPPDLPFPAEVAWLASSTMIEPETLEHTFPQARRLISQPPAPPGDFFLLDALLRVLKNSRHQWGLLLDIGGAIDQRGAVDQRGADNQRGAENLRGANSGFATLVERL